MICNLIAIVFVGWVVLVTTGYGIAVGSVQSGMYLACKFFDGFEVVERLYTKTSPDKAYCPRLINLSIR